MKKLILVPAILAIFLTGCGSDGASTGAAGHIAQLKGQWVVINYWAKWCKPCIEEIPELNRLDQQYHTVTVLGVNFDGLTGEKLASQVEELGVEFMLLEQDPATELGYDRPQVLPTTVILNPAGDVTQILVGPQTLESLARATRQPPLDSKSSPH